MTRTGRVLEAVLAGRSDANLRFSSLCNLLKSCGFSERVSGSHHIFSREGVEEMLNLQADGDKAKAYQVKQVRNAILRYRLHVGRVK